MVKIYDRQEKNIYTEDEHGKKMVDFLYNNAFGRALLKTFVINKSVCYIYTFC